eukprot:CAMPEP_0171452672 /NCGR_PEP_ID=MMETSP0945-20130129/685_1 /TAXON_ID=109269 /ORGANISM="Vaucheria litorea, Strain CCMP2940" /LENGTH=540 /DNA_ID=CAMNT_0011977383 /DNA_START=62 /DNA_END=1684 /DNA_ORIENTATION=+
MRSKASIGQCCFKSTATVQTNHRDYSVEEKNEFLSKYLNLVLNARVYDIAVETPLQKANNLSNMLQNTLLLKREDLQPVYSFKIRGAYNKIASCSPQQLAKGVVACSAGNHAQGVALSAAILNIRATIVMPLATPKIKVNAVKMFGGPTVSVMMHGQNYDEAADEAKRLEREEGLVMVHPFDDPQVIAGQGTVAMEILKSRNGKPLDIIFACVGGGGLISGIATYVKAVRPSVKIIGVEASDAASMTESLKVGRPVSLKHVGLFADGAAVRVPGSETFKLASSFVDDMITVSTDEICQAIKMNFNDTRCVMEPAGVLAVAGATKYLKENKLVGTTVAAITSGANMDFDRLRFVSERADFSETLISVTIPESPGSFRELYGLVFPRNVTEFSYRYHDSENAHVLLSFQSMPTAGTKEDAFNVIEKLNKNGFTAQNLSENDLAKDHARYFVGGRTFSLKDEKLFRFEFPEAPGALSKFLNSLKFQWNITLFHYRNHGSDYGRVLVGLQVTESDVEALNACLKELGYTYYEETFNPVFRNFFS